CASPIQTELLEAVITGVPGFGFTVTSMSATLAQPSAFVAVSVYVVVAVGLNTKPVAASPETPVVGDHEKVSKFSAPVNVIVSVEAPAQIAAESALRASAGASVTVATTAVRPL